MTAPLWQPGAAADQTLLAQFQRRIEADQGRTFADYFDLHDWSVAQPEQFWRAVWALGVIGEPGDRVLVDGDRMPGARFFPDARLNFTENLLRRRGAGIAIHGRDETGTAESISWDALHSRVEQLAATLAARGVRAGDRVAAIVPNCIDAVVCLLATARIGAVFSSASPDFGAAAIVDRFGQIEPRVLVTTDVYHYNGKRFDVHDKCAAVASQLPGVELTFSVQALDSFIDGAASVPPLERFAFDHPLYIMYSSGTTGTPKCIVHRTGGALLKHLVEHRLHADIRPGDTVLYFTTCGWMMWNWLVGALGSEATICLYDGSPFHPDPGVVPRYLEATGATHFGTSPGYIGTLSKLDYRVREQHDTSRLRVILSTGSPLSADGFTWAHENIAPVQLASITGGTDILGCFAGGVPTLPVHAGEIQAPNLGMAIEFRDESGQPVRGKPGELVCTRPFPSMPLGFWGDDDGSRYHQAYFAVYDNVWHHGDYGEFTEHGGIVIHGRSDAVLNRGGVRIGTAEIYRQAERVPEVLECLAVAQQWREDVRIVLFVRLADGAELADVEPAIRAEIRNNASPRHVPDLIVQVDDLPRTRSGKLSEIAVREILHGRPVRNTGALANPEALDALRAAFEAASS